VKYKQVIIDIVYERGCVTRKEILREVRERVRELREKSDDYVEFVVDRALKRLVESGVVVRKNWGVYCRP
jgi:DNA-binding HxlR family transcriptional regulator